MLALRSWDATLLGRAIPSLARVRPRAGCAVGSLICTLAFGAVFGSSRLLAQRAAPVASPSTATAASPAFDPTPYPDVPEAAADTGRMQHGWHDFSRYSWVGNGPLDMCAAALYTSLARVWRHAVHDTATHAESIRDTIPTTVRQIAARCGARDVLPAAVQQMAHRTGGATVFWPAYSVAVLLGRDSDATILLHGLLAQLPTRGEQATTLWGIKNLDITIYPQRLALIERDAALAESLFFHPMGRAIIKTGQADDGRGFFLRTAIETRLWQFQHWLHMGVRDTAQLRVAAETFLATCARLDPTGPTCLQYNMADVFLTLTDLAVLQHGVRSREVVELLNRMTRAETRDSAARGMVPPQLLYLDKPFVWPTTQYWYSATGAPVSPPDTAGQSPVAVAPPGKVTLIWDPGPDDHRLLQIHSHPLYGGAADALNMISGTLHKLLAKYGPQGLQLVIIAHTRGAAAEVGAVDEAQEAVAIRHVYQDLFHLPAGVVVVPVPFRYLPDGRRQDGYSAWERRYIPFPQPQWRLFSEIQWYPLRPILLDRHGKIRLCLSNIANGTNDDPILELYIQQVLNEP